MCFPLYVYHLTVLPRVFQSTNNLKTAFLLVHPAARYMMETAALLVAVFTLLRAWSEIVVKAASWGRTIFWFSLAAAYVLI